MVAVKPDRRRAEQLTADEIVDTALAVLDRDGLDAVSMRRVAAELGVSPIPLYSRVGNKEALLDAMAERLAQGLVDEPGPAEPWPDYARRWCHALRARRLAFGDSRLLVRGGREAMVATTRPLIARLTADDIATDRAIDAARLLLWSVLGHVAIELGRAGSDSSEVAVEAVFADHVRYLVDGLERDLP